MKKIFLSLILSTLSLHVSAGELAILKTQNSMSFSTKDFSAVVPNYMIDKKIRNMDATKLAAILESGNAYLSFKECSDGNYAVDLHGRVKGGGYWGATIGFWTGRVAVYGVGYGAIHLASLATGPLYPVTVMALSAQFAGPIEGAAMVGGALGGLAGGVATGPV